jgi:hypothetical protein
VRRSQNPHSGLFEEVGSPRHVREQLATSQTEISIPSAADGAVALEGLADVCRAQDRGRLSYSQWALDSQDHVSRVRATQETPEDA